MILLVSGGTTVTARCRDTGDLIVPGAGNAPDALRLRPGKWAMDNGAFSGFDAALFMRMLERFYRRPGCRFVAAPDCVADAHQTMQQWPFWSRVIRGAGFLPAFVAQDGLTVRDIPWAECGALFIGGFTEWKLGRVALELAAFAKARGVWVHVGRVNSARRITHAALMGADSIDGSSFSRWSQTLIPKGVTWIAQAETPRLF